MKLSWRDYDSDRADKTDIRIWNVLAKAWPYGLRWGELEDQTGLAPRTLKSGLDRLIEAGLVKRTVGVYLISKHRVSDQLPAYLLPPKERPAKLLRNTPGYMLTYLIYPVHDEKRPTLEEMDALMPELERRRKEEGNRFDENGFWERHYKKSHPAEGSRT